MTTPLVFHPHVVVLSLVDQLAAEFHAQRMTAAMTKEELEQLHLRLSKVADEVASAYRQSCFSPATVAANSKQS